MENNSAPELTLIRKDRRELRARGMENWLFSGGLLLYLLTRFIQLDKFPIFFFTDEAVQTMLDGKEPKMNEQQAQEVMMAFLAEQQQKAQAKMAEDAKTNLEKGEAFLKENAAKEGVKTTASGLQYQVKTEGSGPQPKADEIVTVEYEGRLIDGSVFDSSKQHGGEPVTFPLNQVIPGWTEGLQLMKEGSEYTFFVPAKLAYGDRAMGDKIGPNSTLVFDVKLVKVGAPKAK